MTNDDYFNLPENYRRAFGQGVTQQEAYDNWLLDLTNDKYN